MTKTKLREQRRKDVVAAIAVRGEAVVDVARIFDVPERTVFTWLARYRAGGWGALKEGARNGRPRKVDGKVMRWLYRAVTMGDPRQHQFEFCLWTLGVIRSLLKQTHGIEVSKSSVSRLLRHLGLSPQRPIYRCYKQDPKKIEKYLKKTFPQIRRLARDIGADIYFVDEAAVRSDSHRGTTWGKPGETPVVGDGGGRFGLKLISAVSPRGDMRFSFVEGRMNSGKFIAFLKKLRADAGRPIIVIADNASYHISGKVKSFASDPENGVWLENLPAYAPELNPDEQVWNHAKRRLAKLFIATKAQMKAKLTNIMRSIQKTRTLLKSFFQMKDTKYACAKI
jgi:transposase